MNNETTIKLQRELINLYEQQIMDLTMMSKIELGDDVIEEIKRLKELTNIKMKEITLINTEGPNLRLRKTNVGNLIIIDEWDTYCGIITKENMTLWLEGKYTIVDSKNREWNWLDQSEDCRRILPEIEEFIQ